MRKIYGALISLFIFLAYCPLYANSPARFRTPMQSRYGMPEMMRGYMFNHFSGIGFLLNTIIKILIIIILILLIIRLCKKMKNDDKNK